jgi:RNA polymerase sigma-19 factor, ECF subfamily
METRASFRIRCTEVFTEHREAMVRTAYRHTHSWDAASDIVQTAFEHVLRLPTLPDFGSLRAYVYRAIVNLSADHRSRTAHRAQPGVIRRLTQAMYPEGIPSSETVHLDLEFQTLLQRAVGRLPAKARMAFTLVEIQGLSVRHAARQMGLREPCVYQAIGRAYARLAQQVIQSGWRK